MTNREIRGGIPVEIRADDDGGVRVSGYAAVFNEEADIGGMFREVIAPGAFRDAIGRDDVPFLINHDGLPLARSRAGKGTLKLKEDSHGLRMETRIDPDDPDAQRIIGKMRRGDLDKMSFAFRATVQEWDDGQDPPLRTLRDVELFDVSVVTLPAYEGTEVGLRGLDIYRERVRREHNFHAARRRRMARTRMERDLSRRAENG